MSKQNVYVELTELMREIVFTADATAKENKFLKISLNNNRNFVYIVDVITNKVVYINDVLEKQVGDIVGTICYESLQGLFDKCDFCVNSVLKLNTPHTWVHYNKQLNKVFYIIDVLKEIDGTIYKFEKATDITDQLDALQKIINEYKQ